MKQLYEVTLKYTALVLAEDSHDAERVAREEEREITGDDSAQIEAGVSFRSSSELYAWAALEQQAWDSECCPYGGDKSVGRYLAEIEQADATEAATAKCLNTKDMFTADEPERPPSFQLLAARKNANAGDDWQWARMEWIGNDEAGGCLIEEAYPTSIIKAGLAGPALRWKRFLSQQHRSACSASCTGSRLESAITAPDQPSSMLAGVTTQATNTHHASHVARPANPGTN